MRASRVFPLILALLVAAACAGAVAPTVGPTVPLPTFVQGTAAPTVAPTATPSAAPSASPSPVVVGSPTPTPAPTPSSSTSAGIAGEWSGTWQDSNHPAVSGRFHVSLMQSGSALTGTITISNSCVPQGTVSGSIDSSGALTFGAVKGNSTITFTGQWSGDSMSGDYDAPGEACGNGSGTWSATRD